MFKPKRDSDQTRIKLPRRTMPPTADYLHFAFVQAFQYRGKEVEITWTAYSGTQVFFLLVKAEKEKDIPLWSLWEDSAKGAQFLWSAETADLVVVENKVASLDPMVTEVIDNSQRPFNQDSPYRKMFSSSYHGIRAPQPNSLRESFTRIPPVYPMRNDSTSTGRNPVIFNHKVPSVNESVSMPLSAQPPQFNQLSAAVDSGALVETSLSVLLSRLLIDEFTRITGSSNAVPVYAVAENIISGTLEQTLLQNKHLINAIASNHLSGMLELINQNSGLGRISFIDGAPCSAAVMVLDELMIGTDFKDGLVDIVGDDALLEIAIWSPSSFKFFVDEKAQEHNVNVELSHLLSYATGLKDELNHLEKMGLKERSIMVKKQDGLGDNELRLLFSKNTDSEVSEQVELYKRLPRKFTAADIFQDGPLTKARWIPIIYRFFANGLIDIKPPLAVNETALNFMEEGKAAVQALKASFIRQESGVLSYPALLYFLQYEYLRFQSYDTPLSLIVFEMSKISSTSLGGLDLINQQETAAALHKIGSIKRPLDFLAHFETINYALLLPHSNANTAVQMAKHMTKILTTQRLIPGLDPSLLKLSFGIGSVPFDCENVEELISLSKKALLRAKNGDFMIVQAANVR